MSPTPEPRRALSPLRTALFAVVVAGLVLTAANHLIELAEDAELVETSHPADRIQYVEEPLFARDGEGHWMTTPYAEETIVRQRVPVEKGDAFRLFAVGGSFMMGSPYVLQGYSNLAGSIPWFLQEGLTADGGRKVEVVNAAAGAQNSSRVVRIVEQVALLDADAILVATCNNEGEPPPSTMRVWLNQQGGYRLLKRSLLERQRGSWYTPQDPDTSRVRDGFRGNLRRVIKAAQKRGVHVFLATLPVNLRYLGWDTGGHIITNDPEVPEPLPIYEPPPLLPMPEGFDESAACVNGILLFEAGAYAQARPVLRQCLAEGLTGGRLDHMVPGYSAIADFEVNEADAASRELLAASFGPCLVGAIVDYYAGRYEGARTALEGCPDAAESLHWVGRIHRALGEVEAASAAFEQAIEVAPRNRCRPSFNAIIREEAASSEGVTLVDLERAARAISPDGLPGDDIFLDYCHMNWRGYGEMARAVGAAVDQRFDGLSFDLPGADALGRDERLPAGTNAQQVRVTIDWTSGERHYGPGPEDPP